MKRKIVAALLAASMVVTLVPNVTTYASTGVQAASQDNAGEEGTEEEDTEVDEVLAAQISLAKTKMNNYWGDDGETASSFDADGKKEIENYRTTFAYLVEQVKEYGEIASLESTYQTSIKAVKTITEKATAAATTAETTIGNYFGMAEDGQTALTDKTVYTEYYETEVGTEADETTNGSIKDYNDASAAQTIIGYQKIAKNKLADATTEAAVEAVVTAFKSAVDTNIPKKADAKTALEAKIDAYVPSDYIETGDDDGSQTLAAFTELDGDDDTIGKAKDALKEAIKAVDGQSNSNGEEYLKIGENADVDTALKTLDTTFKTLFDAQQEAVKTAINTYKGATGEGTLDLTTNYYQAQQDKIYKTGAPNATGIIATALAAVDDATKLSELNETTILADIQTKVDAIPLKSVQEAEITSLSTEAGTLKTDITNAETDEAKKVYVSTLEALEARYKALTDSGLSKSDSDSYGSGSTVGAALTAIEKDLDDARTAFETSKAKEFAYNGALAESYAKLYDMSKVTEAFKGSDFNAQNLKVTAENYLDTDIVEAYNKIKAAVDSVKTDGTKADNGYKFAADLIGSEKGYAYVTGDSDGFGKGAKAYADAVSALADAYNDALDGGASLTNAEAYELLDEYKDVLTAKKDSKTNADLTAAQLQDAAARLTAASVDVTVVDTVGNQIKAVNDLATAFNDAVDAIPEVKYNTAVKSKIDDAVNAYTAFTAEGVDAVDDLSEEDQLNNATTTSITTLAAAQKKYLDAWVAVLDSKIDTTVGKTISEEDVQSIAEAKTYHDGMLEAAKTSYTYASSTLKNLVDAVAKQDTTVAEAAVTTALSNANTTLGVTGNAFDKVTVTESNLETVKSVITALTTATSDANAASASDLNNAKTAITVLSAKVSAYETAVKEAADAAAQEAQQSSAEKYDALVASGKTDEELTEIVANYDAVKAEADKVAVLQTEADKVSGLNTQVSDLQTANGNLSTDKTNLTNQVSDLQKENGNLSTDKTNLTNQVTGLNTQVSTLSTDKTNLTNQVNELTAAKEKAEKAAEEAATKQKEAEAKAEAAAATTAATKKGDTVKIDGNTYTVTDVDKKTVSFTAVKKNAASAYIVSTVTINGVDYKVTAIAKNAFKGDTKLTSVTIPTTVKTIGESAFSGCTKLASIVIPKNVTSIGKQAFYKCSKLKTVTIKSSKITKIGSKAFTSIAKKATIKVPSKKLSAYKKLLKTAKFTGTTKKA